MKKATTKAEAFILIAVLQAIRELFEWLLNPLISGGSFKSRMITMSVMMALTAVVILYAKIRKTKLSVFPKVFNKKYIVFTVVAAVLLITTPSNYTGGIMAIMLLFYGSIVTPVFEELIFRGYLWNRFSAVFTSEKYTYFWSIILFTVWHIGYMIPNIINGNWNAVLWKLAAGVSYGTVLGFVRLKTKNCYSTMLLHGMINIFMV